MKTDEQYVAHRAVSKAVKSGDLTRQPCELCGREKAEAHHEDYAKPLAVVWLCRMHHVWLHRNGDSLEVMRRKAAA